MALNLSGITLIVKMTSARVVKTSSILEDGFHSGCRHVTPPTTALLRARLTLGTISFDQGYINVPESFFGYIYPIKRLDFPSFCSLHVRKLLYLSAALGLDCG